MRRQHEDGAIGTWSSFAPPLHILTVPCLLLSPGKTTSIPRAKTRYYGRVTVAVSAFQGLGSSIEAGTKSDFFDGENSGYEELKSAGYLLAVAFKWA